MQDPDGWAVLSDVEMHGTAFKQRKVTVRCTVSELLVNNFSAKHSDVISHSLHSQNLYVVLLCITG